MIRRIRGGSGLGDSLYVQSVARHLVSRGVDLEVCSDWPEVFQNLPVTLVPFSRANIDYLAHYSKRKEENTDQFVDCCLQAGIKESVNLTLDWKTRDTRLTQSLADKRILLVHGGREPMARKDRFGRELLPNEHVFNRILESLHDVYYIVQIGSGAQLYPLKHVDLDLTNKTSVSDLFDLASIAKRFMGQVSFIIPLAESFDKKALIVWAHKGLSSQERYIARIIPQKILHKVTCSYVVDNWPDEKLEKTLIELV